MLLKAVDIGDGAIPPQPQGSLIVEARPVGLAVGSAVVAADREVAELGAVEPAVRPDLQPIGDAGPDNGLSSGLMPGTIRQELAKLTDGSVHHGRRRGRRPLGPDQVGQFAWS